jgi:hypothetical protein
MQGQRVKVVGKSAGGLVRNHMLKSNKNLGGRAKFSIGKRVRVLSPSLFDDIDMGIVYRIEHDILRKRLRYWIALDDDASCTWAYSYQLKKEIA